MNVEPPRTLVIIESIVYKSNGFAIVVDEWLAAALADPGVQQLELTIPIIFTQPNSRVFTAMLLTKLL